MSAPILIIEDHPAHRAALLASLRGLPAEVEVADSGEAALVRLGTTDFRCIVIGSPVGVDFAGESSTMLELFERMAPALAEHILVVADPRATEVIRLAVQMRVFALILAPFEPAALREAVRRCIEGETPLQRVIGASEGVTRMLAEGDVTTTW